MGPADALIELEKAANTFDLMMLTENIINFNENICFEKINNHLLNLDF